MNFKIHGSNSNTASSVVLKKIIRPQAEHCQCGGGGEQGHRPSRVSLSQDFVLMYRTIIVWINRILPVFNNVVCEKVCAWYRLVIKRLLRRNNKLQKV